MRYFPVARPAQKTTAKSSQGLRRPLTLFGAVLVIGGLVRLATDDSHFEVATGDLAPTPTRAASSEREPDKDHAAHEVDSLDAAIVSMLADRP